jgi:hypothetical protein
MELAIVLFFISLGFALVVLQLMLRTMLHKCKPVQQLTRDGVVAEAILLHMQQTGLYVRNLPQVKLKMRVHPRRGREFETEVHEVLSFVDMSRLHIGKIIQVKYNPANAREIKIMRHQPV